jgi:hypothetical protein
MRPPVRPATRGMRVVSIACARGLAGRMVDGPQVPHEQVMRITPAAASIWLSHPGVVAAGGAGLIQWTEKLLFP